MRIFGKTRKEKDAELTLARVQENDGYDFLAALAKALLVFLLVYGAIGGFLSAFDIEYNSGLCITEFLAMALVLSAAYESGRKWLINLISLGFLGVYLRIAVVNYWVINSGYYAILNRFYEKARNYLDVESGVEYSLAVDETYATVTMFVLFLGMMGVMLFHIMLKSRCSLLRVVLLTLTPYVIPFYFDCSPDLIYILMLLAGYLAVAVLRGGNVPDRLTGQMRSVLPFAVVVTVLTVRTAAFLLPETAYERMVPKSAAKAASEEEMVQFAQYGLAAMLRQGSAGVGVSGGRLSRSASLMPTYETVLTVRYTPYEYNPVYLKAFTGMEYLGDRWSEAGEELPDDGDMAASVESRRQAYADNPSAQGRGVMEVEKADEADEYEYRPYYTSEAESAAQPQTAKERRYVYYPAVEETAVPPQSPADDYLTVPDSCLAAVREVCDKAGFSGTEEEIAAQIVAYFDENYDYTLRPGYYFGNPDYISHFLLESKKGYCAHFASAAVMLFRQMGIPARYAEGFAFSYLNVVENGELVEEASYDDYYDGYSPIGRTGLIELEIPDAYAHAWVEIYVEGRGWVVVDPTPAQSAQEGAASFWDAFLSGGGESADAEMTQSNLGDYLEGALGGACYVLLGLALLAACVLAAVRLRRAYRESRLTDRERVKLEYGRLQTYLDRKYGEFRHCRTLREQLVWLKGHGAEEIDDGIEEALYRVYFAEEASCDCEALRRRFRRIRIRLYLRPGRICRRVQKIVKNVKT